MSSRPPSSVLPPPPDSFIRPTFKDDVDVERYLQLCRPRATTRGAFFDALRDAVEERLGKPTDLLYEGLAHRRFTSFKSYPLSEFMRFAVNAAQLLYPKEPLAEGLRRVGWLSFPCFAKTIAGRVVLFALGEELEHVLENAPKAYTLTVPYSTLRTKRMGERHWRLELRDVDCFVEHYHVGVIEGAVKELGFRPDLTVRKLDRWCDADFDLRWK